MTNSHCLALRYSESRPANITLICVATFAFLVSSLAYGEVVIDPPEGLAKTVGVKRGPVGLHMRGKWNSCSVTTRGGKGMGLIDPVLYGLSAEGTRGLYWCERGWARLKWRAVEQGKERDVVYVEGEYEGWLIQAWIAMYGDDEAAYIRKRITRLRETGTVNSARGVMAVSHGKEGLESSGITVVVDGDKNPFPQKAIKRYVLFRKKDTSAAAVNPGEEFQKRGNLHPNFGDFIYHPKPRFVEASLHLGQKAMKAGEFVEYTLILLWGDGDISARVKNVLAEPKKFAARLPAPERPVDMDKPAPALPAWPTGRPGAVIRSSFYTRKGRSTRVWATGAPLAQPPVIDAKLDDAAWKGKWAGQFILYNTASTLASVQTSYQVRYDARALYLVVRCDQPSLDEVKHARHTPKQYSGGEQVEIFLRVGEVPYQICVDPEGGWYDSKNEDVNFDLKRKVATAKDAKGWQLEAEIPFSSLDMKTPETFDWMRFNVARNAGQIDKRLELSAWNAAMGQFAGVNNFGTLFFGTVEQYRAEQGFFVEAFLDRDVYDTLHAAAGAWVNITATAGIPEGTKLLAGIADKSGKLLRTSECAVTGDRGNLTLDIKGLGEGEYQARFRLAVAGKHVPPARYPFRIRKADRRVAGRGRIPLTVRSAHACPQLPVSTGVAFPKGELTDPSRVRLLNAEGREVPLHTSPLATWDPAGSISWLRLNFQTPVEAAKPRTFSLEYGVAPAKSPQALSVTESAERFVVSTGPLQFTVPRTHGGVLESVFLDANGNGTFEKPEQVVAGDNVGPYLVDGQDKLYEAANDKEASVVVEERGSLKAVFRIESWYQARDGAKLCKHVTRVTAYAGLPHLRLEHTWIMTAATGEAVFKDIALALPVTQRQKVAFGTDMGFFTDYTAFPRYLLQDTYLHYEIHGEYRRTLVPDAKERGKRRWRAFVEGGKAPGWIAVKGDGAGMVLAVDEFWQNFPKELGVEEGRVTFHVWPKHGRPRKRPVTDGTITKLDFVHGGEALDFKLPPEAANHKTANKYEQGFIKNAAKSNAIGIAKTHRLALTFFPASSLVPDMAEQALAVADTPSVMASPEWMTASGVFGPLHPRDPENFPEIEEAFQQAGKIVPRLNHYDGFYGMWIYGQLHTDYSYPAHRWDIYRLLNQLHHNGPRWPWIMYFRSGDHDYLDFALANTRTLADVGFCHYSRPEFEKLPWPLGKVRGALTDYKGLVPWHSGARNPDYNSLTAFLLWHYYMTGDGWTRDVVTMWGELAKKQGPTGGSRTGSGTVRAALDLYTGTWDPALIPVFRRTARALLGSQYDYGGFPAWENYTPWLGDYWRFTGEERARSGVIKWADAYIEGYGDVGQGSGYGTYMNVLASAYFASGDVRYARECRGILELWTWGVHSDPESHLRGNFPGKYAREMSFFGNLLVRGPYVLAAWADAGKPIRPLYPRSLFAARQQKDGSHKTEVLILDETDTAINIALGGSITGSDPEKEFRIQMQLLAPDGATARQEDVVVRQRVVTSHGSTRAFPRDWTTFRLPADGKKGVYRLRLSSKETAFTLKLPVSDRKEVCPLATPGKFTLHERFNMASFYLPKDVKKPVLRFNVLHQVPTTVQIRDPEFKLVRKVYLMGIYPQSKKGYAEIPLPDDYEGGFWTVLCGVAPHIDVECAGDWKPTHFAVWPDRAFNPEEFGVAVGGQ